MGPAGIAACAPGAARVTLAATALWAAAAATASADTSWFVPAPRQDEIAGYAGSVSYAPGDAATLFVDSGGADFDYAVYRMGYAGGSGGQLVATGGPVANSAQPAATVTDDRTQGAKLLVTGWHASTAFAIPSSWQSGFYLVRLTNLANGGESYAGFTLRAATPASIVVVAPTNTWQAYNHWGGLSLYHDSRAQRPAGVKPTPAHQVSFLRPYAREGGAGDYFRLERPLVDWIEQRGYPVSYATDADVAAGRALGPATRLVIVAGHAEYVTSAERDAFVKLVRGGTDLALFGGNDVVWQARYGAQRTQETVWRRAALDPVKGAGATIRFEQTGWDQNRLTGEMQVWGKPRPQRALGTRSWSWRGCGVADGARLGRIEGWEFDGAALDATTPRGLTVLARTRLRGLGRRHVPYYSDMVLVHRHGRSFVFDAGQLGFTWDFGYPAYPPGVDPAAWVSNRYPASSQEDDRVECLAANLIARATGARHGGAPLPPPPSPRRFRVFQPARGQDVPFPARMLAVWGRAPAHTRRIRITLRGHVVATARPRRGTAVFASPRTPRRFTVVVTALGRRGRLLARRRIPVHALPATNPVFRSQLGGSMYRAFAPWDERDG